jgi:acyl carrier protein
MILDDIRSILRSGLQLEQNGQPLLANTPLIGALPEFDSMAVVTILTLIEEKFGITVEDDDVSADVFQTVGHLASFVESKVKR